MKIKIEVKKVMHHNKETLFTVLEGQVRESDKPEMKGKKIKISGIVKNGEKGDVLGAEVQEVIHPIYGQTYKIQGMAKMEVPVEEKAIIDFVAKQAKKVKGIGRKKVEAIVERFGADTLDIIRENPMALREVGITQAKAMYLQDALIGHEELDKLIGLMSTFGVRADVATDAYMNIKGLTMQKVLMNPYILIASEYIDFKTCDKLATQSNVKMDGEDRLRAAIIEYLTYRAKSKGDVCVSLDELLFDFEFGDFLEIHGASREFSSFEETVIRDMIDKLMADKLLSEDLTTSKGSHIYLTAFLHIEENTIKYLQDFKESEGQIMTDTSRVDEFIKNYEKTGLKMAKNQKEALYMVASNKISTLEGGPGTGKTTTVGAIVKMVKEINPDALIRLLAPTGKASKRIAETTGMPATTIHRALGIKGFGNDDEDIELTDDFIVVDESSMIDAQLFYKLLKQTSKDSRILLVGDPNQLDSVGAGRIFGDIVESGYVSHTKLTEVFRQAAESQIVSNAHMIIENKDFSNGLTADHSKGDFYFIEKSTVNDILDITLESMKRFLQKGNSLSDIMVLSPMKAGTLGTENLNEQIQYHFNPPTHYIDYKRANGGVFRVGDRVIHTENNVELRVFNGEIGVIDSIVEKTVNGMKQMVISVQYPDKENVVDYYGAVVNQLELAYCITVHKSQGSEANVVIMPVHKTQEFMLDRSLLYTGMTRAKKTVVMIGSKEDFNNGVGKVKSSKRVSLVKEKLMSL